MEYNNRESFCEYQNDIAYMELKKKYMPRESVLDRIMLSWDIYQKKRQLDNVYMNSLEYYSLNKSYREVIFDIANLFRNMEIANPITIFSLYNYLYKKGYFSLKHSFAYAKKNNDCYPFFGTNVIEGEGVCRHITAMLTDIYKELGYESYNFSTVLNRDASKLSGVHLKKLDDEENIKKIYKLCSFFRYPHYDHLVTLVNDEEFGTLVMDPTNSYMFIVDNNRKIRSLLDKDVYINGEVEGIFNDSFGMSMNEITPFFNKEMSIYYTFYYYQGMMLVNNYLDNYEEFYNSHKSLYLDVVLKKKSLTREFYRYIVKR